MPSRSNAMLAALAVACLFAGSIGCHTTVAPTSTLPRLAGNDPEKQLDFWHEVAAKNLISHDEAFHGILLYLDGKDDATTYQQRVATLKARGYLPQSFDQGEIRAVERGT